MIGFIIQIIGIVISLCGWFALGSSTLVYVGTAMILLIDLMGLIAGMLKSPVSIIIGAIVGAAVFHSNWLVGACLGITVVTIIMSVLGILWMRLFTPAGHHAEND